MRMGTPAGLMCDDSVDIQNQDGKREKREREAYRAGHFFPPFASLIPVAVFLRDHWLFVTVRGSLLMLPDPVLGRKNTAPLGTGIIRRSSRRWTIHRHGRLSTNLSLLADRRKKIIPASGKWIFEQIFDWGAGSQVFGRQILHSLI